jgi:hypothetical protein
VAVSSQVQGTPGSHTLVWPTNIKTQAVGGQLHGSGGARSYSAPPTPKDLPRDLCLCCSFMKSTRRHIMVCGGRCPRVIHSTFILSSMKVDKISFLPILSHLDFVIRLTLNLTPKALCLQNRKPSLLPDNVIHMQTFSCRLCNGVHCRGEGGGG